ncbi:MAG: hypothetical protein WKF84_24890 [Pyrinomonadaceae bacterium]
MGVTRVLIDEQRGRQVARMMGLEVTGSIGVLLRAKREGLLAEVKSSTRSDAGTRHLDQRAVACIRFARSGRVARAVHSRIGGAVSEKVASGLFAFFEKSGLY